jgi:hypothetical protein
MSLHYPGFSINVDISDHYESLMGIIHHYDPVPINPNKNYWGAFDRGTARHILHRLSKADRMDTRLAQISNKMRLIAPDFNLTWEFKYQDSFNYHHDQKDAPWNYAL